LKNTNNYFFNMSQVTVAKALDKISISQALVTYIRDKKDIWPTFGKKNSHLLRAQLFRMYEAAGLSSEEIFMIHFFFAVIKNRDRVKQAMENMEQEDKAKKWYKKVYDFIDKKLVQYVSQEKNGKFAVVHLPTTMPGLDLLCTALTMEKDTEDLSEIIGKQTFAQLDLDDDLQAKNKTAQIEFWNNTVKTTRNPDQSAQKVGFVEDFYNTSAGDTYFLVTIDGKEVEPDNLGTGYTEQEIYTWFKTVMSNDKIKK